MKYGGFIAVMELENLNIVESTIPKRCQQLVRECAEIYQPGSRVAILRT